MWKEHPGPTDMALAYPPISDAFLRLFGVGPSAVVWDNPSAGTFGLVVPAVPGGCLAAATAAFTLPTAPPPLPPRRPPLWW